MTDPKLGKRYADALYEAALDEKAVDEVIEATELVGKAFEESEDLRRVWDAAHVQVEKKVAVINEVFAEAPELVKRLLNFLLEKKRGWVLFDLLPALRERYDRERGLIRATLTTAIELNESEIEPFREALMKRNAGGEVVLTAKVDPSVVAGFQLRYGDKIIDASVARSIGDIQRLVSA